MQLYNDIPVRGEDAEMNEEREKERLRERAVHALRATDRHSSRGPKTIAARIALTGWVDSNCSIFKRPGYIAMSTPAEACRWLEYVVTCERGRERMEAVKRAALQREESQ